MKMNNKPNPIDTVESHIYVPVYARKCLEGVRAVLNGDGSESGIQFLLIGDGGSVGINLIRRVDGNYRIMNVVLDGVAINSFEAYQNATQEAKDKARFAVHGMDEISGSVHSLMPYILNLKTYNLNDLREVVARLLRDVDIMRQGLYEVEMKVDFERFEHSALHSVSKRKKVGMAHSYQIGDYIFTFRRSPIYPVDDVWNMEVTYCGYGIDDYIFESVVVGSVGYTKLDKAICGLRKLCEILDPGAKELKQDALVGFIRQKTELNRLYNYDEVMALLKRATDAVGDAVLKRA